MRAELEKIISDSSRILTDNIDEKFSIDEHGTLKGKAEAVVFPISTEEVSEIMKFANANSIAVTPRGAGTNLTGSTVPVKGGIVVDLSKMNKILEIDSDTFTATVEAGVVLKDFQAKVEELGLFYPPDPGEKNATIGGNISTNAGGMRAVKYGVTRDYVRGLEVVFPDGSVATVGSKNVKDSSGFSLKNLITGSEGTLAIITKCILKLVTKPEKSVSIIIAYNTLDLGINSVLSILHGGIDPTAVEFVERNVANRGEQYLGIDFPFKEASAYILITIDGDAESIDYRLKKLKTIAENSGSSGYKELASKEAEDIWKVRGALVTSIEAVSEQAPVDVVVPINQSANFIKYVNELSHESGMLLAGFGHAGDGNVHISVVRGDLSQEDWDRIRNSNMNKIYDKAAELGGLTSGEHGIGITKKSFFFRNTDKDAIEVMKKIKKAIDVNDILNSGKIFG